MTLEIRPSIDPGTVRGKRRPSGQLALTTRSLDRSRALIGRGARASLIDYQAARALVRPGAGTVRA